MNRLVAFRDTLEDNADVHYGILMDDDTILCLCCLGIIEEDDYEIVEDNITLGNTSIDTILSEELHNYNETGD